jgi:hypothetical protein
MGSAAVAPSCHPYLGFPGRHSNVFIYLFSLQIKAIGRKRWFFLDPKYSAYMQPLRGGKVS